MKNSKVKIGRIKKVYKGSEFSVEKFDWKVGEKKGKKEVLVYPNTVAVLPIINKNKVFLVKQHRFPPKRELWEVPAGRLEKGEKPEKGAERELKEETGFSAGKLKKVSEFYLSPGHSTEYMHLFRASCLKKGKQKLDDDEVIDNVKTFDLQDVLKMIENRMIIDSKTIIAVIFELFYNF